MHRVKRLSVRFVGWTCIAAAISCAEASGAPDVSYTDGTPIGRWQTDATPAQANVARAAAGSSAPIVPSTSAAGSLATAPTSSTSPGTAPTPIASSPTTSAPMALAGRTAPPVSGQGAAGRAAASGGAGASAKPPAAGAPAVEPPAAGAITSLAFQVTTTPVGLRYQPKNIGAIWIEDDSGMFVKSLKVWAKVRARYLTKYTTARAGQAVDVTAGATLSSHQTHNVSWDLKGRSGATVAPGKYNLCAELTDGDATGKSTCVAFDTSAPKTINPPDAASFNAMKLELK